MIQQRPTRPFTIADTMILIPAIAVGTASLRAYMKGFSILDGSRGSDAESLWLTYSLRLGPVSCFVVPLMASLILIRWRQPRSSRFRIATQPGYVACLAVMASLVPGLAWYATIRDRPGFQRDFAFIMTWRIVTYWTASAVFGSWMALILARRFRPEPTWVDRLGLILGAYWLFFFFAPLLLRVGSILNGLFTQGSQ